MRNNFLWVGIFILVIILSLYFDSVLNQRVDINQCTGVRSITAIFYNTFEYQGYDGRQNVSVWQSCDNKRVVLTKNRDIKRTFIAKWSADKTKVVLETMHYDKHPRYGSPTTVPYRSFALKQLGLLDIPGELKLEDFVFLREMSDGCSSTYYDEADQKILRLEGVSGNNFRIFNQLENASNQSIVLDSRKIFSKDKLEWFTCTTGMSIKVNGMQSGYKYIILDNTYLVDTEKNEYVVLPSPVDYEFITR
jgi:hypothetical protein